MPSRASNLQPKDHPLEALTTELHCINVGCTDAVENVACEASFRCCAFQQSSFLFRFIQCKIRITLYIWLVIISCILTATEVKL